MLISEAIAWIASKRFLKSTRMHGAVAVHISDGTLE